LGTHTLNESDSGMYWLFVIGTNDRLYPQAINTCPGTDRVPAGYNNGLWFVNEVQMGGTEDVGEEITLFVARLDETAVGIVQDYFNLACISNFYSGLLPSQFAADGQMERVHQITVTRQ
jgi:hypothetical protein